jgi:hypothetical protein
MIKNIEPVGVLILKIVLIFIIVIVPFMLFVTSIILLCYYQSKKDYKRAWFPKFIFVK